MEITLAALADAANRSEDGKLNLMGVFHTLHATAMPCQHPMMAVVINFEASAIDRGQTIKVVINLINEDGQNVISLPEHQIPVPPDPSVLTPNFNIIVNIGNVLFDKFGPYRFDILVNGSSLGTIPLNIVQMHLPGIPQ